MLQVKEGEYFQLSTDDSSHRDFIVMGVHVGRSVFSVVHYDSHLIIFLCNSLKISDYEPYTFIVHIDSDPPVSATMKFSKSQPYFYIENIPSNSRMRICKTSNICNEPYVGIYNIGVTCYISSAIQFLSNVTPFVELILKQNVDDGTCKELQKLFMQYIIAEKPLRIKELLKTFGNDFFRMTMQEQDSHEFILLLFDKLDKDLGKDFEKLRNDIFGVIGIRTIECKDVNVKKETEELASDIELQIHGIDNMIDSLKCLTDDEKMEGKNQWDTGDKFGKQDAIQFYRYKKLPPFLIFHICRYAYIQEYGRCEELKSKFDCPQVIDMKKYCIDKYEGHTKYYLMSVVAHRGSLYSGHYVTFAQPRMDGNWYLFNDSSVSSVKIGKVKETFGESNGILQRLFSYATRNDFLAYLVGYVREDWLEKFKKGPSISVGPCLSKSYQAKIINTENINDINIYETGEIIKWEDDNKTINDIIPDNGNFDIFVSFPYQNQLIGPIDKNTKASYYSIQDFCVSFILIEKTKSKDPVFFFKDKVFDGIYNKNKIEQKFSNDYNFYVDGILIKEINKLPRGTIIICISKLFTLTISDVEYNVKPSSNYEELQKLIDAKNPQRVLFYSDDKPLKPNKYPKAINFHSFKNISYKLLEPPVTVNSLDLFNTINIKFYDLKHNKKVRSNIHIKKGSTIKNLIDNLPLYFNFRPNKSFHFILSYKTNNGVTKYLEPFEEINATKVRVDEIKCKFPKTNKDILESLKNNTISAIEVQTLTFEENWPKRKSLGFYMIQKTTTANSLASLIIKTAPIKLIINSKQNLKNGYQIDGKFTFYQITEQLNENSKWNNDRPVFVIQLNEQII